MKASLKFRDDQKPLIRAKVPVSILGFPFQSGIVAGESKELSLNLSTFFDSGPSLKIGYRPNDALNPFSLVFKTGIGHLGSPISSSMTMSAEFNLIGNQNPTFFVHFKPQFGDFALKKSQSSVLAKSAKSTGNGDVSDEDGSVEVVESPVVNNEFVLESGWFPGKKITVLPLPKSSAAGVVNSVFSGVEMSARTAVPLRNRAVANFLWGVRFPGGETASFQEKLPFLVMNKIGIEHVAQVESKGSDKVGPGKSDVAAACLDVKRELEIIQSENGMVRKAVDDLRSEIGAVKSNKIDRRSNGDKKSTELNDFGLKIKEGDVNEELKKALMASNGA